MPCEKAANHMLSMQNACRLSTFLVLLFLISGYSELLAQTPPVVINSYRDSNFDYEEWTEIIVTHDNVDLRGFTIRDNSSSGAWQPSVRFRNIDFWNHLRRGTIIVLFHRNPTDVNFLNQLNNNKYDGHIALSLENTTYFEYEGGGSIGMTSMSLAITGDMVQIRNASDAHIHALGHRQDTTVNFAYWGLLPRPKLNHRANLVSASKEAVMVTPGASIEQFGLLSPINGLTYTTKGLKNLPGLPNGGNGTDNATFWRSLRQPDWVNPSLSATYNAQTQQVNLNWNAISDAYPADNIQGYIVLRSTINSFQTPQDGNIHGLGSLLGNATVVALVNGSNSTSYVDNLSASPIPCGGQYYYRVYAFRYGPDNIVQGSEPARGRAYNETSFAAATVGNPIPSTSISINASSQNVTPGTQVTFNATLNNPGPSPIIIWFVNGVQQQSSSSATFVWTYTTSATVTATLQSSLPCATASASNPILVTVTPNPCNPGLISGYEVVCLNQFFQYSTNGTPGGTWSVSNTAYAEVNSVTGQVYTKQTGSFTLFYTIDPSGCTGSNVSSKFITINPDADAGAPQLSVCNSLQANLQANTPLAGNGLWMLHDGPALPAIFLNGEYSPDNVVIVPVYGTYTFRWSITGTNCSTIDFINIQFKPHENLSITINPTNPEICPGESVTFNATASHAGGNNSFQWFKNGSPTGTNSPTFTVNNPANGDQIGVLYQTDAFCLASSQSTAGPALISVLPATASPTNVAASHPQICQGFSENITLTAFGGSGAEIHWYQGSCGSAPIGTGTDLDIAPPAQTTTYFARWETPGCSVSECKSVTITVLPSVQPMVSISASKTEICENETVTFIANTLNGGISPLFQWFKNGNLVGDNDPIYAAEGWQPGDQIYCRLNSSDQCANPTLVQSNTIALTVNPMIVPALRIDATATEVCSGSTVEFSITQISGQGNNPQYQWFVNGSAASGANGSALSLQLTSDVSVYCRLISSEACVAVPFENSNVVQVYVLQQVDPQISITASQTQVCEGTPVSFEANYSGGGNSPGIDWKVNGISSGNQSTFVLPNPADGDVVVCILTSSAACATQPTSTSNSVTLQVSPNLTVSASIQALQYTGPICQGSTVQFEANTSNGGISPIYQWLVNGVPAGNTSIFQQTFNQAGTYSVSLQFTSSLSCTSQNSITSNTLEIIVLPSLHVGVQLQSTQAAVCENTLVQLHALPENPGNNPIYEWFRNSSLFQTTTINQLSINALPGDHWQVRLTSSEQCVINSPTLSGILTLNVDPLPLAPQLINASHTQLCLNSGLNISLNAQGGNGQQVEWFTGSCGQNLIGTGNPLIINAPQQSTTYFARYISGQCLPSACTEVSITVNETIVPQVTIASTTTNLCQGETASFIINTLSGQGSSPVYEWLVNGLAQGINSPTFNYQPANGDLVQCQLQSSEACAQPAAVVSNAIGITANQPVQPVVNIQALNDTVCFTQPIIINSNFTHGGDTPLYQWMVNNNHYGQVNQQFNWYAPSPGTYQIYLLATSALSCVTSPTAFSSPVNIVVLPNVQPQITISAPTTTLCAGEEITISAAIQNQGFQPQFQWYKNGLALNGETSPDLSFVPSDNDFVYCVMVSSERCAEPITVTSNSLTFNVSGVVQPVAQVLTQTNQICQGSEVTFVANITGGGDQPVVEWFLNNMLHSNGSSFTITPQNNDKIHFRLTSSLNCAQPATVYSDTITMQINPLLTPEVTIEPQANGVCQGTPVTFGANAVNGGVNPQFDWFVNGNLQFSGSSVFTYVPEDQDVVQCVLTSSEQCLSNTTANSDPLTMSVVPLFEPLLSLQTSQPQYCEGDLVIIQATVNQAGPDDFYQWYVGGQPAGSGTSQFQFVAAGNQTVRCVLTSSVSCALPQQLSSEELLVQSLPVLVPSISISSAQQEVCEGSTVSFSAAWTHGGDNPAFQWLVNGQILGNLSVFSYQPADDDLVQCIMLSDYACADPTLIGSDSVVMRVSEDLGMTLEKTNAGCNGGTGSITAEGSAGKPPYRYRIDGLTEWQDSGLFSILPPGNYLIIIEDLFGCQHSEQVVVESEPAPVISDIQHVPASNGFSNASVNVIAQGTPPIQYSIDGFIWQSSSVFTGLAAGPLAVFVRDGNGCISQQITLIETLPVNITAGQDAACRGGDITIPITSDGFAAATRIILEIKFDDNILIFKNMSLLNPLLTGTTVHTTSQPGLVRLMLEKAGGMDMPGGGTLMNLVFTGLSSGMSILKWEPVSSIQTQHQASIGANFLNGRATVWPEPEIMLENQFRHCLNKPLEIRPQFNGNIQNLLWTLPGGGNSTRPELSFLSPEWTHQGLYTLSVTNEFGCSDTSQTEVILLACDIEIPVPSAFRPGSSIVENQTFKPIFGPFVPLNYLLQVYNRWGNLVFETNDYQLGWDGRINAQDAPAGVYVWIVRITNEGESAPFEQMKKGTVTLIR